MRVLEQKFSYSLVSLEFIIPFFCLLNIYSGVIIYFSDMELFEWYIQEDGYVESLTAIFLLFTAIIAISKTYFLENRKLKILYFITAAFFIFGAGEEVSWGQRFFGFNTPDALEAINSQGDLTLHNIQIDDVKVNKIVFGTGLYSMVLMYFCLLPILYKKVKKVQLKLDQLIFPVPTILLGIIYLASFIILLVIDHGKVWELQELAFTSFIFMTFLYHESLYHKGRL